ncbi:MAG: DUF1045 domain-containing protein [Proteobacteria bacterium]|nr:DUF1045 domain-containing protein [Pseudomonadota bacterium]
MPERFAIYYAPGHGSPLDRLGSSWLGRCALTGTFQQQPLVPGFNADQLDRLTTSPRRYGFHATLVPPFSLRQECSPEDLLEQTRILARQLAPVKLRPLTVTALGSFLALVPSRQDEVSRLAETCLRALHPLREPPSLREMERRRVRGLTPVQERLLRQWGYPYVLGEYTFHMTLTGSIGNHATRKTLARQLTKYFQPIRKVEHVIDELCLFRQQDEHSPFLLFHRVPMGSLQGGTLQGGTCEQAP